MVTKKIIRLSREDWIRGALDVLGSAGVEAVKIVPLAKQLGVTSGSFYWHFKNRGELYAALLDYWEREMTDSAAEAATNFEGSAEERIWNLMLQVMTTGLARFDLAIWHWAQSDDSARATFQRALDKRFKYARWMFAEAGFGKAEAEVRARMMVVYMMGESTLVPGKPDIRKKQLRMKFEILVSH